MALIDQYTKEELQQIVAQSFSMKEVIDKLGYSTHSGSNNNTVKKRLEQFNIDISHFRFVKGIERDEENIFIEDSTASQATLRKWYKKGEYSSYVCSICGQEPVWQGKDLTLILDHINGCNHDDRLENLRWVCPNCNQQLDTTGYRKGHKKNNRINKKYYCIDCGKEISKNATRCRECEIIHKKNNTVFPMTREELKQLIRTQPFTKIGEKYSMTDNAVRKWCDKYNLPRTKKEINNYSDEEWKLI